MSYVDGFVIAVPKNRINDYKKLSEKAGMIWKEFGALAFVECLADDVPYGEITSFPRAVQAKEDETVVFSWIIYPSRGARDEVRALPTVLQQATALTTLGDRPLIVLTAVAEADPGWVAAQENLPRLSTASVHRVMATATHNSLISGVDAGASSQAIVDILTSIRSGTALR